jgi:hypothetical protein
MNRLLENIETKIDNHSHQVYDVPDALMRKLENIPLNVKLQHKETKRLIFLAAASCLLLLVMNLFALTNSYKKKQSLEFTSTYFDYINSTP